MEETMKEQVKGGLWHEVEETNLLDTLFIFLQTSFNSLKA
jgi:hypothetical protein